MRTFVSILVLCAIAPELEARQAARDLKELFAPDHVLRTHCDLKPERIGVLRATFWKGYENTGFETSQVPFSDWSSWRSLQFDVENRYPNRYLFMFVLGSRRSPCGRTYTGGTFDGFVIGPGHNTVEISLEHMQSPEGRTIDPKQVSWLGIFVQPLFLRDGMDAEISKTRER